MAEMRTNRSRSSSPVPIYAQITDPAKIWDMLQIPELDSIDLDYAVKQSGRFSREDQGRAEQIVTTGPFKRWMLADKDWEYTNKQWIPINRSLESPAADSKLLVHGDFSSVGNISPFSKLSASLTQAFRERSGFVSLVFLCGRHLDKDEYCGPVTMIRSLAGQLLQQFPCVPPALEHEVSIQGIQQGNIHELCKLFGSLAGQVPSTSTIFCIIDGINVYERTQYRQDMMDVLRFISDLAENKQQSIGASLKLLLLSPSPTTIVRNAFQSRPSLLNMGAVSNTGQGSSPIRFNRQISSVLPETISGEDDQA